MDYVGERVKKLRENMGWSQEQLAHQIPVSLSTVQRWEYGHPIKSLAARRELERLFEQAGMSPPIEEEKGDQD